jgi:hypothetical protein
MSGTGMPQAVNSSPDGLATQTEPRAERPPARLAADIRRIRYQLATTDIISQPKINVELTELYRQVWSVQDQHAGRHRSQGPVRNSSEPLPDAAGFSLKPDPLTARTGAELVARLREYRQWAGEPPFRKIAERARQKVSHSTIFVALNKEELPSLKVVLAVVIGCGGREDDQRAFTTAWRRLRSGKIDAGPASAPAALRVMRNPAG